MMIEFWSTSWPAAAGAAAGFVLGWIVTRLAAGGRHRPSRRTAAGLDETLRAAVRPFVPAWGALAGIALGIHLGGVDGDARGVVIRSVEVGVILTATLAVARALGDLVRRHAARSPEALPASTLTQNLVRVAVIAVGLLVVAGQLGIAIAPILTALGVGSLAVALALQPTLTNLFAGIHISLARQVRVGDFVELESGAQGYVDDIGWRSTRIRELPHNIIVVPNARLAEIVVKNHSLPEAEQAALVQVGVSYGSDLAAVERATLEVARDTLREVEGGVAGFDPFIRYHTFGDSAIGFTVILRVREYAARFLVIHEFVKRLHRRYAAEGIEIPFPQRVLHAGGGLRLERAGSARAIEGDAVPH